MINMLTATLLHFSINREKIHTHQGEKNGFTEQSFKQK